MPNAGELARQMPGWSLSMRGDLVDDVLVDEGSLVEEFGDGGLGDEEPRGGARRRR